MGLTLYHAQHWRGNDEFGVIFLKYIFRDQNDVLGIYNPSDIYDFFDAGIFALFLCQKITFLTIYNIIKTSEFMSLFTEQILPLMLRYL
jgi:hypothetical protein